MLLKVRRTYRAALTHLKAFRPTYIAKIAPPTVAIAVEAAVIAAVTLDTSISDSF